MTNNICLKLLKMVMDLKRLRKKLKITCDICGCDYLLYEYSIKEGHSYKVVYETNGCPYCIPDEKYELHKKY